MRYKVAAYDESIARTYSQQLTTLFVMTYGPRVPGGVQSLDNILCISCSLPSRTIGYSAFHSLYHRAESSRTLQRI